jgi:SAM-dependent methyltransferase
VVILDGPWSYGTTVITEVAPGVVQADRRYADDPSGAMPGRGEGRLAPFDPTPQDVVERMLALARVRKDDVIYDLGSGDGRILIAAAKKYGVRGVGYEIDAGLVKLARENIRRAGVDKLVEIRQEDFLAADVSPASVVTLYLSYDGNLAVRDQLNLQLKPGARVVSYMFDMGDWQPKITESYRDSAGDVHTLYLWEVAKPVHARKSSEPILEPYPMRQGPLIIEVN